MNVLPLACLAMLFAGNIGAQAQQANSTVWVASNGTLSADCSRSAPCPTFASAALRMATGGTIRCVDNLVDTSPSSDPYTFSIDRSMTIDCKGGTIVAGFEVSMGQKRVGITISGSVNVVIRGLSISAGASNNLGRDAIQFAGSGSLVLEDVLISGFTRPAPDGNGVLFAPNGAAELVVRNSVVTGGGGAGIYVTPTGSGSARVVIDRSGIDNNAIGIRADIQRTTGVVNIAGSDTSVSGNSTGIFAAGDASGQLNMSMNRMRVSHNAVGINVVSPAILRIGDSVISGNTTGIAGNVKTYGNNQIDANTTQGSPGPVGLQSHP